MDITKTIPSNNPADSNTLDGLNNTLIDKIFLNLKKVCPGIIQSYDRQTNRAVVKPAITGIASQGQKVPKENLVNIPVLNLSGGGVVLSFPIKQGDTGWLIAADRNISIFKQNLVESAPNDYRKHCFEDSFFIPDKINDLNILDNDSFIIQTIDGETSSSLKENLLNLIATAINLTGATTITGDTSITGTTAITGSLTVSSAADGTFATSDNKKVTVVKGIVTKIESV